MSGTAYKALGYIVWKSGMWRWRRRYEIAKRIGIGVLVAAGVAAVAAVVLAQRRNGSG
ncbi:MAG TPA: hypothetical protein VK506_15245 [Conexibacter sp.]|nr:hypothetical protein [Conexibacter sp.]